ncbi:MAG: ATP-binding protein [Verrucomicrobiota bacterium]
MRHTQKTPDIKFNSIRQHHGTCHGGFEELVVSLFRHECGSPFEIIRINGAGGDGGVEAYTELTTGEINGLQTKFFEKLGASQFRQIEDSIKTARENHPTLTSYIVATPLNLTPAQAKRWKILKSAAKQLEPSLKLIWWGESEMVELLTRAEHVGRLVYWFGASAFDRDWLKTHNQRACLDLDTRYTPANHVRVQTQMQLAAFAQAPEFIGDYYEKARRVWITWRSSLVVRESEKTSTKLTQATLNAREIASRELPRLGDGMKLPDWSDAAEAVERLLDANIRISEELEVLSEQAKEEATKSGQQDIKQAANQRHSSLRFWIHEMEKAYRQLQSLTDFIEQHDCTERRYLLVNGEAGAGKSHLLAKFVEELEERGQIALFVLGEYFTSDVEPWTQFTARIGWNDGVEALLATLNHAGELSGKPAFVIIDALNESAERRVWLNHLAGLADRLEKWPWVRLLVSCRNDFSRMTIPKRILEDRESGWGQIEHRGFGTATFDAVTSYFESYQVKARDYPPLLPEFENPLFLKTFAEAFTGTEIPTGPLSLDRVMRQRIRVACEQITKAIDCPPDSVEGALEWLAEKIEENAWQPIPLVGARQGIDAFFTSIGASRSLYHHLKSSGLVTEVGNNDYESEPEVRVRFAYERFSDYFIAKRVLKGIESARELRREWKSRGFEEWNVRSGYYRNRGLMRALAILLPEQLGVELIDVLDNEQLRLEVMADFLLSLPWRSSQSINARSQEILGELQNVLPASDVLNTLLRVSSIPGHPWNAQYLHTRLKPLLLADRDCVWTIPISKTLGYGESVPEYLVQWLYQVETERISDEQAHLIGTVLAWFFSSNDRGFRKRASLAAIKLLLGKPEVVARLVRDFHDVNDPYVVERVFAVAAGVAVREHVGSKLVPLAAAVWETMFEPPCVKLHIHTRHYAHMVMEKVSQHGALPPGVDSKAYKPPYRSDWPYIWEEKEARAWGKDDGWSDIIHSIEPEYGNGMGGYGDFGRYVMQGHVHQWINVRITDPYPEDDSGQAFDENLARRWVLQRVIEFGWTFEKFSEYEKRLSYGRQRVDIEAQKQERIGKKYQWIALRELEALLADHFHLSRRWRETDAVFEGAWQLYAPDFDPTQPLEDPVIDNVDENNHEERIGRNTNPIDSWINYPDPFRDKGLTRDRSAWVRQIPDHFGQLLNVPNAVGLAADALILGLWQSWDEPDAYPPREPGDGVPHMYVHARAWIVPQKHRAKWLRTLRETHFWGDGVDLPGLGASDLGEYPWAKRFESFRKECENQDRFCRDLPPGLGYASCLYNNISSVPSPQIVEILQAKWSGRDFDFVDGSGDVVSTSPRSKSCSHLSPCLVHRDKLLQALKKHDMSLLWGVVGERHCFDHDESHGHVADAHVTFSGVYYLDENNEIKGGLTMRHIVDIPKSGGPYSGAYPQSMELLPFGTKLPKWL